MRTLVWSVLAGLVIGTSPAMAQDANMAGVQVWNCEHWQSVSIGDFYGPNFKVTELKPIALLGARNGVYSGYVVATASNGSIVGLKATVSDLVQADGKGKIPATQVAVRYSRLSVPETSWSQRFRFDRLLDAPPAEVSPVDPKHIQGLKTKNDQPIAMQPIWVTVRVPKDAPPGDYAGKLSIDAEQMVFKPTEVPIQLKVIDWQMPDPKDFNVRIIGWTNPDALARHYGVPFWSPRHFELMGRTMGLMAELGSRHLQVNLTRGYPTQDNEETMVKWVKGADGNYTYDFTVLDKYFDLAAKHVGTPFPIRIQMWAAGKLRPVLVVDEKGAISELPQPEPVGSEASLKFWKPMMDELRLRLEKRGWFRVAGPHWLEYCGGPTKPAVSMVKQIWPDARWVDIDHGRRTGFDGMTKEDRMGVVCQSTVWNEGGFEMSKDGAAPRNYRGKFKPNADVAYCGHSRDRHNEGSSLWRMRTIVEDMIMRGDHGLDPVGADMFPRRLPNGRIIGGAWTASALGPGNCTRAILGPGPDGPVGTERFEAMREGLELCEAVVFMQMALDAKKITGEVATKANKVLDEQAQAFMAAHPVVGDRRQFVEAPYIKTAREHEEAIYSMAAEVAQSIK